MRNKKTRLREMVDCFERGIILKSLHRLKGNVTKTSNHLGVSRNNFHKYIDKHNLREDLEIIRNVYSFKD